MPREPETKRVAAFIDGQNLLYAARNAFGFPYPNYDPLKLAQHVVASQSGWVLTETFFYTGIPGVEDDEALHSFWAAKLAVLGTRGVRTYSRGIRYRERTIVCPHGEAFRFRFKQDGLDSDRRGSVQPMS